MILTLFTPTYNRAETLKRLYCSLCNQTCKEFIWMIVDDGSMDDTKDIVQEWIKKSNINIEYYYQKNGGKYRAHNCGVKNCKTELFACIDSDDYMVREAVGVILKEWGLVKKISKIAGMVAPREIEGNKMFSESVPEYGTLMDLYNKYGFRGETLLVYKTDILKKFYFPEIPDEKFMKESVVYWRIDNHYTMKYIHSFLSRGEYLDDGLSKGIIEREIKNPVSTSLYYKTGAVFQDNFIKRIKFSGCYYAWKEFYNITYTNGDKIKLVEKILGNILKFHYKKLFEKQSL